MRDVMLLVGVLASVFGLGVWLLVGGPGTAALVGFGRRLVESGWAVRFAWIAGGLLLCTALALAVTRRVGARSAFAAFAASHDLQVRGVSALRPLGEIVGSIDGAAFELRVVTTSDLHHRNYRTHVRMALRPPEVPAHLQVLPRLEGPRFWHRIVDAATVGVAPEAVSTGDPGFDRALSVRAAQPERARSWLSADRRAAIQDLLTEEGFLVHRGALAWTARYAPTTESQLENVLSRLRATARRLNAR